MPSFHSQIAPNNDHLAAIGRVAVQWTFLENTIEMLVWQLASLKQPLAQAVTTHIPTLTLIDIANSLAHRLIAESGLDAKLKGLLNHISQSLRPKRNSVVHGIWGPAPTPDKVVLMETTARGVLKFKFGEEMTAEDIMQIAADIDKANWQLTNLVFEISSALGPKKA
jgi:hypothetical protein